MFDIKSTETAIPVLILILFFWGLFLCFIRQANLKTLSQIPSDTLIQRIKSRIKKVGIESTCTEMNTSEVEASPLLRRIRSLLKQWLIEPEIKSVDFILQEHVAYDEAAFHRNYSVVRLFVWALPVLGLIGTVIGISIAVGGFAHFLGGSIDEVAEIKKNLVSVTGGLSFAFLITLEGLATSLILMFISSNLQNKENRLMSIVQKIIIDEMVPFLQQVDRKQNRIKISNIDTELESAYREELKETKKVFFDKLAETSEQIFLRISTKLNEERQDLDEWLIRCSKHFKDSAVELSRITDNTNNIISNTLASMTTGTAGLTNLISQKKEEFDLSLKSHESTFLTFQNRLSDTINKQTGQLEKNINCMNEMVQSSQLILKAHEATISALQELNASNLSTGLMKYGEVMERQILQTQELGNIFADLSNSTGILIKSHQALQDATIQFHQAGFSQALSSAVESLNMVVPVLKEFSKPFVIKAIPIDPK